MRARRDFRAREPTELRAGEIEHLVAEGFFELPLLAHMPDGDDPPRALLQAPTAMLCAPDGRWREAIQLIGPKVRLPDGTHDPDGPRYETVATWPTDRPTG